MVNVLCGALGLLGAFVFGWFFVAKLGYAWRYGRLNDSRFPPAFYGCIFGFTGPLLVAGLMRVPGVGWRALLAPVAQAVLLSVGWAVARFLGATRRVSLVHTRSTKLPVRQAGVAKLLLATDPSKDRVAREAFEKALQFADSEVLRVSAVALFRHGMRDAVAEALAKPFLDPDRAIREGWIVADVLKECGAEAAGPLLKLLESSSIPAGSRVAVLYGLRGSKEESVVRGIRQCLEDSDPYVRAAAVEWIGVMDPPGAREMVLPTVKDASPLVRIAALRAFEARRDRSAGDDLLPLADDPAPWVRRVALEVLGKLEETRVAGAAVRALKEPDDEHRYWAIVALGNVRAPEGVDPLLAALEDRAVDLRPHAARSLGQIGDRRACDGLARSLRADPLYPTRVRAAEALEGMGWQPSGAADRAALALARGRWDHPFDMDAEILEAFDAALKDGDAAVSALPRLARLVQEKATQIPDSWLLRLSELYGVRGPLEERRGPDLLDCQPVRQAARSEMARRAATK